MPSLVEKISEEWACSDRWKGIKRAYTAADVVRLSGSLSIEYTLARHGATLLWELLHDKEPVIALGAVTGMQAVQMVKAGLKAIYCSGWQIAADANLAQETYPDFSLYPSNSMPLLVKRINASLRRADAIDFAENKKDINYFVPIVVDGEAGFGGALNAFELTKWLIEAGVAAVHFEDQLPSAKKCGHMRSKVLVPTREALQKLIAARLASDILGVSTIIIARTDADGASFLSSDVDERDREFIKRRTEEGFFEIQGGLDLAIARALVFAPYVDILWFESSKPDLLSAQRFAEAIHRTFPGKLLAYNCSPSFYWKEYMKEEQIASFHNRLASWGYKLQVISLAGFHSLSYGMFTMAKEIKEKGLVAYSLFQEKEKEAQQEGYTALSHQHEVGASYFELIYNTIVDKI
ncbi:isocitrate lyase [Candidatus Methylacidiphilum fumarolicum]|uniref:Isocitrate lyase n=2 Tax=Candidatus Methylacidiphilum fumarolicum TaxID=591154 RepID=I0JWX4_METFB|nr:isocitrate lyase [Candidatus Methylacidiphilum fumarolicum]MBW6414437.1 isocitrate lyase [Candidatus Methylacidiphilum fumarolicum]TFE69494.1 isocitrate lyase [Candidatus Methylacidiphilum fumarolicum]TFE72908.1 isocitrate lyase [Candidatus Methylacidiphilum fumarolicum]TFE74651.1 isocitrate lyase [Candidatus Methylacidiphilum fumarolicum]TFE77216.1 isocitrate lyase [Candidatus Methylacidiphilum fumarolicum]